MDFYKPINPGTDYTITPYKSYANQRYVIVSGSLSNPEEVTINRAEPFPANWSATANFGTENDISGLLTYPLYASVRHLYYSDSAIDRLPYASASVQDVTKFIPSSSFFVINIAQYAYGERILPGSFNMDVNGSGFDVRDVQSGVDGLGLLYISSSQNVIGNIFYNEGIAVIKEDTAAVTPGTDPLQGIKITSGSTNIITFQSQVTIYQHRVVCKVSGDELNVSILNPSARSVATSGEQIQNLFKSGSLMPYQTTVGLYNAQSDLVAVAKLATPIKRTKVTDQIFIVQFDSVI